MGTRKPFKLADTRSRRLLLDTASVCGEQQDTCRCKHRSIMYCKRLETIVALGQTQAAFPVESGGVSTLNPLTWKIW
jgi:hypothetical protein